MTPKKGPAQSLLASDQKVKVDQQGKKLEPAFQVTADLNAVVQCDNSVVSLGNSLVVDLKQRNYNETISDATGSDAKEYN